MNTELAIVNSMLSAVGERRQNTLDTPHPSVVKAREFIEERNRTLQTKGWWFNRETKFKLVPNEDGELIVPSNYLSCSITSETLSMSTPEAKARYNLRGTKMYDSAWHTYKISHSLWVDLVLCLPVEELPQAAYDVLRTMCIADFYLDDDGDIQKHARLEDKAMLALIALKQEELKQLSVNVNDRWTLRNLHNGPSGYNINPVYPGGLRR